MVKSIRRKFVLVTVALMVIAFSILAIAENNINRYWWDNEAVQMLEAFADADSFSETDDEKVNSIVESYASINNPIMAAIVDDKGNIISTEAVGGDKVDEALVSQMLELDNDGWKVSSYLYTIKHLENGNTLVVYMDSRDREGGTKKKVAYALFILLGIILLIIITAILSRFVTQPATAALKREKQFVSDASHELKTPLGSININAQAAAMAHPDDVNVSNIVSESARMARLVERMLTLSSLEETYLLKQERVNFSELVEGMTLTFESAAYDKDIILSNEVAENLYIFGDHDELEQLVAILIDNAIKNTNAGGRIDVNLREESGNVAFGITNTGEGISKEHIAHIFDRFYTKDPSHKDESFGLGLSIAKAIVTRHGGTINVTSTQGEETKFEVIIRKIKNI